MTDIHETPAVPPADPGGDERIGLFLAGSILVALGWGAAIVLNLALHATAPSGGMMVGPARIFPQLGTYAWTTAALGVITGGVGVVLLVLGRRTPGGRFVLPGTAY